MGKYRTLGTFFDRIFRNDLNANFTDIDADVKAQKARVDNLITATPQPSEVVDLRTDTDGVIHGTAWDRFASDGAKTSVKFDDVDAQLAEMATNAKTKGAIGDGIADDIQKIDDTILEAGTNNKIAFLPKGTYAISRTLKIGSNVRVKGAGIGITTIKWTGTTGNVVEMANIVASISRSSLEDLTIDCNGKSDVALYLRYLTNGTYLKNIEIINTGVVGVDFSQGWYATLENVRVRSGGSGDGWKLGHDVGTQLNSISFIGCQAHTCGGAGFNVKGAHGNSFISCQSENTNLEALIVDGGGGYVFQDFYAENNAKTMLTPYVVSVGKNEQVFGGVLEGGMLAGNGGGTGSATVYIDKAYDWIITGTKFEILDSNNRPEYHINVTTNAQGITAYPAIISNSSVKNFQGKITIPAQKNSPAIFPYGIKSNSVSDYEGTAVFDFKNMSLRLSDGRNITIRDSTNIKSGFLSMGATTMSLLTYDGTNYNLLPVDIQAPLRISKLKTAKAHPASYAQVYVDTTTGELYRI